MPEIPFPMIELLREDRRYKAEAYQFVREALTYAQEVLGLGTNKPSTTEQESPEPEAPEPATPDAEPGEEAAMPAEERHLTGQQLCEAIRQYALEQFGYMAKVVLNSWGIHETGDFGEIVYNLIKIGFMKKSPSDRRADFDGVYDFDEAFQRQFKIQTPE